MGPAPAHRDCVRATYARNPLFLNPDDAAQRGARGGRRGHGSFRWPAAWRPSSASIDALRPGVVASSHGYGERTADDPADVEVGVNVNRLLPSGPGSYERYSSMAFMVGVPVEIERVDV